jgi:hypothetical protein
MSLTRTFAAFLLGILAACGGDSGSGPRGGTRILLTDSPFPYDRIARVDVHVVRVQIAASADTSDPSGQQWTTIAEPNRTINLLELQSGNTTLLGETTVNAASVGAVRVVINTTQSSVTDNAGQLVTVRWPVNGEMAMHAYVQTSLALLSPDVAQELVIDFDVGRSFEEVLGDGSLTFIPWIRALNSAGAGSVAGVVRDGTGQPVANVAVTVLNGSAATSPMTWWKIATGRTDAEGKYKVAFILPGNYVVRAEPVGAPSLGCVDQTGVAIGGEETTLDLSLPAAPGTCARSTSAGGGPDSAGTGNGGTGGNGGGQATGPVAAITITVWPQSPAVGDSTGAFANLTNAEGAALYDRAVTWSVSNANVLEIKGTFGQSVLLTPKAPGTATLTAVSEGITATRTITVH